MNPGMRPDDHVDGLLRAALTDDLPSEVAAGMRSRIAEFRAEMRAKQEGSTARGRLFGRGVWAALALLMLIVGSLLQGFRFQTPLAERIALLKAEAPKAEPVPPPEPSPADRDRESAPGKRPARIPHEKETIT